MSRTGYNKASCLQAIEGCDKNIAVLEKAIADERENKAGWKVMLDDLERADKAMAEAQRNVVIEIEVEGSPNGGLK